MKRPSGLALLVGGALLLLPILALLQYRWIGQVSDAERERAERSLRRATRQMAYDVDVELARIVLGLALDGESLRRNDWSDYAGRYAAWYAASTAPELVRDVLLVDGDDARLRLRRWDPAAQAFVAAEWPVGLLEYRARFERELAAWRADPPDAPVPPRDLISPDGELIVAPVAPFVVSSDAARGVFVFEPVFGYTLVTLDPAFMRTEWLPELVERHFMQAATDDYRVAIVERHTPADVVYSLNVDEIGEMLANGDADELLFGMRPDAVRRAADSLRRVGSPGGERRRSLFLGLAPRRGAGDSTAERPSEESMHWRLVARHRAGSLQAAVTSARTRNLLLSFGILLLMAGTVAVLAVTTRRAQRLARQQIEFVAAVSHELRTPVSVIAAAGDNLAAGVVSEPGRVKQYGARIQTESRRLGETVERVLLYAGIEAGRAVAHRAPVAVEPLIREVLSAAAESISEAGATIALDVNAGLPPVFADAAGVRASVSNLLANAIKYGGADRWVGISATAGSGPAGREVRIAVADHGMGIAPGELPHVFEPFYRGREAQARQIQGNGLGLAIVKGIVQAHGGRITVQSRAGQGSTFVLHLPIAEGAPALDAGMAHAGATASSG